MARRKPWEVEDGLWERIEPLLPKVERRFRYPGRRRLDDRAALCGVLFVLYTAIPWEFLPQELGFGSGMTCWRRLRDWHEAGVWDRLHELLLAELHAADQLDWSKAVIDSSHVRAMKGGPKPAQNRPGPGRSRPAGLETPPHLRRERRPARPHADRRQPQRRHPAHPPAQSDTAGPRPDRPAPAAPEGPVRGQGL